MDFVEKKKAPMPLMLEIGLSCEKFHTDPAAFGMDSKNPKVIRDIRMALSVYHSAISRKQAKKKVQWDKANPEAASFLQWARRGKGIEDNRLDGLEVRVEIPTRGR